MDLESILLPSGIGECPGGIVLGCKKDMPLPVPSPSKFSTYKDPSEASSLFVNEQGGKKVKVTRFAIETWVES